MDERKLIIKQIEEWTNYVNWDLVNPYVMDTLIEALKQRKVPVDCLGNFKGLEKSRPKQAVTRSIKPKKT